MLLASCGRGDDDTATSVSTSAELSTGYCAELEAAAGLLDAGGSEDDYHELLRQVTDESPVEHTETWMLMRTLSEESFSYDNFNVALDSLDRITPSLDAMCPGLGAMVVDDDGRMRMFAPS